MTVDTTQRYYCTGCSNHESRPCCHLTTPNKHPQSKCECKELGLDKPLPPGPREATE